MIHKETEHLPSPKAWIPVAEPDIGDLEVAYVTEAVKSGWVSSLGRYLLQFETEFAAVAGTSAAVSVNNGSAALQLALRALQIGVGNEVIVPAHTFAAVPAAVLHVGATPVFVDIDDRHWSMDAGLVLDAITEQTRAIIAVHSYGHPVDLDAILPAAARQGIHVIEDCAEALGATYKGRPVGSLGTMGAFSFYGNKVVTTGEGGMVTTSSGDLAERMRYLRDHAMEPRRRYYHASVGFNFRLTNPQAALGCAQLARLDGFLKRRREIVEQYRAGLAEVPELRINPAMDWATPVNWMTTVQLPETFSGRRDDLMKALAARGVDTRPAFVALTDLPPYRRFRSIGAAGEGTTPVADRFAALGMSLPTSTRLTDENVAYVCDAFTAAYSELQTAS